MNNWSYFSNLPRLLKKSFLNLFFPEICLICEKEENILCKQCKSTIIQNKNRSEKNNLQIIDWIISPFSYKDENIRKCLFYLKYHHTRKIAESLAEISYKDFFIFIKNILKNKKQNYEDILFVPIPISKKRLIERDYNQSELILENLIKEIKEKEDVDLKNQIKIDLLIKIRHTIKFAATHSVSEREALITDAFQVDKKYQEEFLKNKIIMLVDDITTTGATFYEARNTLTKAGYLKENIFGFAIAH